MVGNIPNFNELDVVRAFLMLDRPVSRLSIVKKTGLGEGTVRGVLNVLKKKKLISSTRRGHSLSITGMKKYNFFFSRISPPEIIPASVTLNIFPGTKKAAAVIKKPIRNLKVDYRLRDIAVKAGAEGAVILKYDSHLRIPGVSYTSREFSALESMFELKKGNLLVACFAKTERDAVNSALAVCIEAARIKYWQ